MKNSLMAVSLLTLMCACHSNNNNSDAVQAAKDSNAAQISGTDSSATTPSQDDASFLVEALAGSMMEVKLGKIAEANSHNSRVQAFGRMMVEDHTKGGEKIKEMAVKKQITLPDTLSNDQQREVSELKAKRGSDFDNAYMKAMVDDHQDDIKAFQSEVSGGQDADIKALTSASLTMLNMHLDSAIAIQKTM